MSTAPFPGRRGHSGPPLRSPSRTKPRAAIFWSGGKDSCTALLRARRTYDVIAMITLFDEAGARSRSHGLSADIIDAQAQRLGMRSLAGRGAWDSYTNEIARVLWDASALGVTHLIFGDIRFDAHRAWNERVCAQHDLMPVLPLWREPTRALAEEFIATGGTAIVVTTRAAQLDKTWLGRAMTMDAVRELEALGLDPCGENGEYHTLVTGTPLFDTPLEIETGACERRSDCWTLDVSLSAGRAFQARLADPKGPRRQADHVGRLETRPERKHAAR